MILLARFPYNFDPMPLVNRLWSENIVNSVFYDSLELTEHSLQTKDAFIYKAPHQNAQNQQEFEQDAKDFLYLVIYNPDDLQTAKTILEIFLLDLSKGIKPENSYSLTGSILEFVKTQFVSTPVTLAFIALAILTSAFAHFDFAFVMNNLSFDTNNFIHLDFFNTSFNLPTTWQIWRYFTPSLIHSDLYMLIFAIFWFFIVSLNVEKTLKSRFILLLLLTIGILNILNFAILKGVLTGFYPIFHALLTFAFVQNNFIYKKPIYLVPNVLFAFIMVFLVLGLMNISNFFGDKIFNFLDAIGVLVGGILASFKFLSKKELQKIDAELESYSKNQDDEH